MFAHVVGPVPQDLPHSPVSFPVSGIASAHINTGPVGGNWYPEPLNEQHYIPATSIITEVMPDGTVTVTQATNVVTPAGYYPQPVPGTSNIVVPATTIGTV